MKDAYENGTRLTGILYLQRISDNRMTGSSLKNLSILRSICGMKNLPHVMLATTMWPLVTTEQGNKREAELISTSHFWGSMKSADPIIRRYDNTRGGAIAMVDELLQMSPIVLQIQEEMAVRKMALIDTEAGQKVNIDLKTLEKKHKEELEEVRKELILVAAEGKAYFLSIQRSGIWTWQKSTETCSCRR